MREKHTTIKTVLNGVVPLSGMCNTTKDSSRGPCKVNQRRRSCPIKMCCRPCNTITPCNMCNVSYCRCSGLTEMCYNTTTPHILCNVSYCRCCGLKEMCYNMTTPHTLCNVSYCRCCDANDISCWTSDSCSDLCVKTNLKWKLGKRSRASQNNTVCRSHNSTTAARSFAFKSARNLVVVNRIMERKDDLKNAAADDYRTMTSRDNFNNTALVLYKRSGTSNFSTNRVPREISPSLERTCDPNIPSRFMPVSPSAGRVKAKSDLRPTVCGEGEYLDWFECKPCRDGTFMTLRMSQDRDHVTCEPCYEPRMYEIVVEPCTRTRDAKIMCEDGYFRSQVPGKPCQSECTRCDVCGLGKNMFKNYEARRCGGDVNTLCCHGHDMVAVNDECVRVEIPSPSARNTSVVPSPSARNIAVVPSSTVIPAPSVEPSPSKKYTGASYNSDNNAYKTNNNNGAATLCLRCAYQFFGFITLTILYTV